MLVILYDCVPNMKIYYSIDRLFKSINVLQVGTGKIPTTPLYNQTKKVNFFLTKNPKNNKIRTCLQRFCKYL